MGVPFLPPIRAAIDAYRGPEAPKEAAAAPVAAKGWREVRVKRGDGVLNGGQRGEGRIVGVVERDAGLSPEAGLDFADESRWDLERHRGRRKKEREGRLGSGSGSVAPLKSYPVWPPFMTAILLVTSSETCSCPSYFAKPIKDMGLG